METLAAPATSHLSVDGSPGDIDDGVASKVFIVGEISDGTMVMQPENTMIRKQYNNLFITCLPQNADNPYAR